MLQDCLSCIDWEVIKAELDLEEYTSSVLAYLFFCTDSALPSKSIKMFPNQKPYLDSTACAFHKTCDAANRSGDLLAYSRAPSNLRVIKTAQSTYKQRIEGHLINYDPCSMCKGIQTMTDCKCNDQRISLHPPLPDTLNHFFTCFDTPKAQLPQPDDWQKQQTLILQ